MRFNMIKMLTYLIFSILISLFSNKLLAQQFAGQVVPEHCQSARVKLQILGSRGPELLDGQASTGYLIWLDEKARVLVDTGTGSLQRFKQSQANFDDVDLILFSHFHVDHSADFSSYIKGAFFSDRKKDLHVFGPTGTKFASSAEQFVERSIGIDGGLYPYLGSFADLDSQSSYNIKTNNIQWSYSDLNVKTIYNSNGITVKTVSTHHGPFPSQGYRVEVGGCAISFTGDMSGRLNAMPNLAKHSRILVAHNAIPENATGVAARLHMTPSYIGKMAKQANVKKLLLTHLMKRSLSVKKQTLEIIKKQYNGEVLYPNDLDVINP